MNLRKHRKLLLAAAAAVWVVGLPALAQAGNVIVTSEPDGEGGTKVKVQGDGDANDITITVKDGKLVVTGADGTTINFGGKNEFPIPDDLKIEMGTGSDSVTLDGVDIDSVRVEDTTDGPAARTDDETITISGGRIGHLHVRTGRGDDTITNNGGEVENNDIDPGEGDNTVTGFDGGSQKRR